MEKLNRIYILGTVGSGKSDLARRISKKLKIKHYDLDDIYWEEKYVKRRISIKRAKRLRAICGNKKWIIEGVYGNWIGYALKRSEVVILLDFPFSVLVWRIFKKLMKNGRMGDFGKLIRYAKRYKKDKSSYGFNYHRKIAKKNNSNCVFIDSNKKLEKFFQELR